MIKEFQIAYIFEVIRLLGIEVGRCCDTHRDGIVVMIACCLS